MFVCLSNIFTFRFPNLNLRSDYLTGVVCGSRPWAVAQNYFVLWHPSGEHLVYGLFERHIGILLPKIVPKQKTCQVLRKRVICDYLLLNCLQQKNRNFEFNNNKNDLHHEKEHKKLHTGHLNSFFILRIVFELFLF